MKYLLTLLLSLCFLLTGCWDARDIENKANILAVAVDKTEHGYKCSFLLPTFGAPSNTSDDQNPSGGETSVVTGEGSRIMTALQNASNKLDEPLFFGYTLQLLLGEDFAKEDLTSLIDILRRIPDLKRDIQPFVIKGKAEQAFKTKLPSEPNLAFFLRELFKNPKFYDDKLHFNSLGELYRDLSTSSSKTGVLPYLAAGKEELQLLGSALIQANKLVDTLTIEETSILNNLRDCKPGALTYLQLPNKSEISFLPYKIKTNLKVKDQVITYRVQLEGGLSENTSQIIASTSAGNKKLEKLLTSYYNDRAEKLIKKLQTEQLDPLLLGRYLAAHYPDYWVQENWPAQFQMLPIKVKYKIHLSSAGLVTK